jgi:hypothetical protein
LVEKVPRLKEKPVCLGVGAAPLRRLRHVRLAPRRSRPNRPSPSSVVRSSFTTDCAMSSCTAKMSSSVRS